MSKREYMNTRRLLRRRYQMDKDRLALALVNLHRIYRPWFDYGASQKREIANVHRV